MYIYIYILSLRKNVENVFLSFFFENPPTSKTFGKRWSVSPRQRQEHQKKRTKNVWKTYEKRWGGTTLLGSLRMAS